MTWVVDASVAIQWFVPDRLSQVALDLLDDPRPLLAPDLIATEVVNALWRRERQIGVAPLDLPGAIAVLIGGAIRLRPATELLAVAVELARRVGRSVPECVYLALAVDADATLVTADRKLVDRLKPTLYGRRVAVLDDLAPAA
jgi:predicted nucleic acid-binding protein